MTVIVDSVNEFPPEFGKNYYHINVNEVQIHSFHFKKKKKKYFFLHFDLFWRLHF